MIEAIVAAVAALLGALASSAPEIVSAITGGQTAEEAIRRAREAAQRLPVREDDGAWDADLAARKARGAVPPVRPRLPVDIELGDMPAGVMLPSRLPGNPFDGGDK